MGARNPYRVLGVDSHASGGDIRRAYHTLARRYHPDAAADESGDRFVEINDAYQLLSDPSSRADYDRAHQQYAERRHQREFGAPLSLSSLFDVADALLRDVSDLGGFGFVHEGMRHEPDAIHYDLTLSPLEAERGGRFRFQVPIRRPEHPLYEERAVEINVPPGVRDGVRAELTIDGIVVDVTVRIE